MMKNSALVVVDMLYDFIDGSMACKNSENAVNEAVMAIDRLTGSQEGDSGEEILDTFPILFVCDHHPADHSSFKEFGGIWPAHCVQGTHGGDIHASLKPYAGEELTFYKGCDKNQEQYSGWEGMNKAGQSVEEVLDLLDISEVYICGIATEYCVKATAEDLFKAGKKVTVLKDALGYVDRDGHIQAMDEMRSEGILIA